ncbi:hypothetical protein [Nonomuraea sp. NPDC046570]|uniref:hypothetical protein n=1 Tax=Nonomuraea sp. NPDC046570 TaxID=3155255 RepID=UPI0033EB5A16
MIKRSLLLAAVAAASVLLAPTAASASASEPLVLRKGLTLYLPSAWKVYGYGTDRVHVVTGKCANPRGGYNTPKCDGFWVFGPKAIKTGNQLFHPYTAEQPYYPATDVQQCPFNGKWGQVLGSAAVRGVRQVGPGHKAHYREWKATCISYGSGAQRMRYTQREWFLPQTKVLIVDQWNTPGLGSVVKNAVWR